MREMEMEEMERRNGGNREEGFKNRLQIPRGTHASYVWAARRGGGVGCCFCRGKLSKKYTPFACLEPHEGTKDRSHLAPEHDAAVSASRFIAPPPGTGRSPPKAAASRRGIVTRSCLCCAPPLRAFILI